MKRIGAWWRSRVTRREAASAVELPLGKLRSSVRAALQVLRESGLEPGRRGGRALPWYLVLGDGAVGKSSALRAAGFEPVLAAVASDGLPMVVEAWCSAEAVAWELSGTSFEHAPAGRGGQELLRELSRRRPRRALDGVVLTLAADQLLAAGLDTSSVAQRMRAGLDALERQLGLQLPVYLLLTKVDALPDFAPFWSGLEAELCEQPWGASWQELAPAEGSFAPVVKRELGLLAQVLHVRALHLACMAGARAPAALFGFPERFAELGARLTGFVQELTEVRPCRPRVSLRGFYLCSAHPPSLDAQASGWFFRDLFRLAILADRGSGCRSSTARERDRLERALLLGAILLGSLAVVVPASLSRSANLELIASTSAALQQQPAQDARAGRADLGQELDPLLAQLERLEQATRRFRIRNWWGPYSAPTLRDAIARAYEERLKLVVSGPVQDQLLAGLRSVGDVVRFDWSGFLQAERALKLYLMLSHPQHLDVEWAVPELLQTWERARQRGVCGGEGLLEPHVRRWLAALAAPMGQGWRENQELVRRVQSRLSSLPVDEFSFSWLVAQADAVPPLRATQIFDAKAAQAWNVRADIGVPGVYTRAGWEKLRPAFDAAVVPGADAWVFGQALPPAWSRERLQEKYFERYARAWRDFARALGQAPGPPAHSSLWADDATLERIEVLCEADGPLVRWFQRLESNVRLQLADPAPEVAERAAAALSQRLGTTGREAPLEPLERELRGLLVFGFGDERSSSPSASSALSEYQKELRGLLAGLRQQRELAGGGARDSAALSQVALSVERLLAPLAPADREAIQGLLLAPIEGGLAAARRSASAQLAERWRREVAQPVRELSERYPFQRTAAEEVALSELQGLFAPRTGTLWKFVETELGARVSEVGGRFESRAAPGNEPIAPGVLDCLDAARELREAWFGVEGSLGLVLALRLSSAGERASALSLQLDGASVAAHEVAKRADGSPSAWASLRWPGAGAAAGAALQLRVGSLVDEVRRTGSFGWLRLLDHGGLHPASGATEPGTWEAHWELNHGRTRISVELRPQGSSRALSPELFERVRCPAALFIAQPFVQEPGDPA